MNIHDHYEPEDAPTHDEREHGLFIIDVPLTYHERLEHAAQHGDMRADFELWWRTIGKDIPDRLHLAQKAWLWTCTPRLMATAIACPLRCETDNKWMAWYVFSAGWAVATLETELELAQVPCVCQSEKEAQTIFDSAAADTPGFNQWWQNAGSGIPVNEGADHEEHARKVALFAYEAGMQQAKGGAA